MFNKVLLVLVASALVGGTGAVSLAAMRGGGHENSSHQQVAQAPSALHSEGELAASGKSAPLNVGNKICPVSGEKIDEKTKATYEHGGKVYNFCCASCIGEFRRDPAKYIKKVEAELQSTLPDRPQH